MTDDRWQRVKALFQAAVERPASEREAFLASAAGDDDALRREVESLLASDAARLEFDRLPLLACRLADAAGVADRPAHRLHRSPRAASGRTKSSL